MLRRKAYRTGSQCSCPKISETILPLSKIRGYYEQKLGLCHVAAVVFKTVKGKVVCSDPKKPWVERAKKILDAKKNKSTTAVPTRAAFRSTRLNTAGQQINT
ncbi:C-C motif chemokine 24-like isoform X2 [Trichomycterus rosablanca]|uniref:C-C motif chemokine 24-like isoform X2 n=1 Tax=Trichomycterus rosablanca TaxID=2290929 RepID=UPI002F3548E3